MSDLRVLYSFPLRVGVSGIGTTAWQQVAGLTARGVRVYLYCGSCERPVPGVASLVQTMRLGPWKVPYRLIGNDRAVARHDRTVAAALPGLAEKVEIIHCWPRGAAATLAAARRLGLTSLLERPNAHTAFCYEEVAREHRKLRLDVPRSHTHAFNPRRLALEEAEYGLATKLACPSEFVRRTFLDRGFEGSKLACHQYGYDPAIFGPVESGRGRAARRGITACFVGRCEPRKGLHYALTAWLESPAAETGEFFICGRFVPGYRKALAHVLSHRSVRELGYVSDVHSIMRRSDVLLLPSVEEGSALVTYEARACGCVLLVSDATGARCTHMKDSLVHQAGDVDALRAHLALLTSDRKLLVSLREASIGGIGNLTWSHAARRLCTVYDEALYGVRCSTS